MNPQCPSCDGITRKIWSWCRKKNVEDSGIERQQFMSRSTRYVCDSCGYKFIKVAKIYNSNEELEVKSVNRSWT